MSERENVSPESLSYGERVSTIRHLAGAPDIKGQNNLRQALYGVSLGVIAGAVVSLGWFAGHIHEFTGSLPGIVSAGIVYAVVAAYNALKGQSVEEVAREVVDTILGKDENDAPSD